MLKQAGRQYCKEESDPFYIEFVLQYASNFLTKQEKPFTVLKPVAPF